MADFSTDHRRLFHQQEEVARAEGGKDIARRPSQHPSATPPRSTSLPPSSYASLAGSRGSAGTRVAVVGAVAVRPAGAQAGSWVLGAATALQH
jgi:hypothetical protein